MAGLPNFRQIFALSRTAEEDRRVRWTALGHFTAFVLICALTGIARDGPMAWVASWRTLLEPALAVFYRRPTQAASRPATMAASGG